MEPARHPFPVSSTAQHYRRTKSESQEKTVSGPKSPPTVLGLVFPGLVRSHRNDLERPRFRAAQLLKRSRCGARTPNPGCDGRSIRYTRSPGRGQARSGQPGGRRSSPLRPCGNPYGPLPRCTSRKATHPRWAQGSSERIVTMAPPFKRSVCCSYSSVSVVSIAAAGMISASSPSISRNCLAVTKPMVRPVFFVSRIQAIFSMSHLLGSRLSS